MHLSRKQKITIRKKIGLLNTRELSELLKIDEKSVTDYAVKINKIDYKSNLSDTPTGTANNLYIKNNFSFTNFFKNYKYHILVLLVLVFSAYAFSVNNEFVSDDVGVFTQGGLVEKPNYLFSSIQSIAKTVPNWINYKLFGYSPASYRIMHILMHFGSTLAVFIILYLFIDPQSAFVASALVAVHPLFTESVVWVSAGNYVQYSFLFLLSLLFYILSSENTTNRYKKYFFLSRNYILSLTIFCLSLLTSEKSIILFLLLLIYEILRGKNRRNLKNILPFMAISIIWSYLIFFVFPYAQSKIDASHFIAENRIYNPFVQIPVAISAYWSLLFWPKNLSLYHPITAMPILEFVICLLVFFTYIITAIYALIKDKLLFFWLIVLPISLIPTFSPVIISWVVAERYVYLGAISMIISIVLLFKHITIADKYKPLIWIAVLSLILLLVFRTNIRNLDWKNYETLYTSTAKTAPTDPRARNNLGDVYLRKREFDNAEKEFLAALKLRPKYAGTQYNLGLLYYQKNDFPKAIDNLELSLKYDPKFIMSLQLMASIYYERGAYRKSIEVLSKISELTPRDTMVYTNLGMSYWKLNEINKARNSFSQAIMLDPENNLARSSLQKLK